MDKYTVPRERDFFVMEAGNIELPKAPVLLHETRGMPNHWDQTQDGGLLLSLHSVGTTITNAENKTGEAINCYISSQQSDQNAIRLEKNAGRLLHPLSVLQCLPNQMGQIRQPKASLSQHDAFGSSVPMPNGKSSIFVDDDGSDRLHPTTQLPMLPVLDEAAIRPNHTEKPLNGQLTIFYDGMVNVYDNVPAEKARAIMLLAGSANRSGSHLYQDTKSTCTETPVIACEHTPSLSAAADTCTMRSSVRCVISKPVPGPALAFTSSVPMSSLATLEMKQPQAHRQSHTRDLPLARKASLARFLERRRDRIQAKPSNDQMKDHCNEEEVVSFHSDINTNSKRRRIVVDDSLEYC